METQRRIWRWLSFGWSRETRERELEAELKFHLDEESAERQERGLSPEEARRGARLDLGNLTIVKESTREAWGWGAIETWMQDLRYGMRTLAKNPAFTITAVLSLALGIGANVAIYSIINAVMVRTLPVKDPQELVALGIPGKNHSTSFTNPLWEVIRDSGDALAGMLAYSQERFDLSEGGESRFIDGLWVSGGYFDVLGVPALRGRVLTSRDDRHGGGDDGPVAVISYDFWRSRFQANPGVVGQTLRLNRQTFTVVGVTPPWMKGLDRERPYDVAIPIGCEPLLRRDGGSLNHRSHWWLRIVGRLKPGAGLEETQDRMRTLAPEIFRATMPADWGPGRTATVQKLGSRTNPCRNRALRRKRAISHSAVCPHGYRGAGAADRLSQCRKPAAGPGGGPPAGAYHARGNRSQPVAPGSATHYRERAPFGVGGMRRLCRPSSAANCWCN